MNLTELYTAESPVYTKGEVVMRPPAGYDPTGLPPRPAGEQRTEVAVNIHNLSEEIKAAEHERARAQLNLAAHQEAQGAGEEELSTQAERAELAALDAEAQMMGDAFPADRGKRRTELRQRLELDPDRQATILQAWIQRQDGVISDRQGRLKFERERQERLEAAEQAHQDREVIGAAQRVYWGVATPADIKRLSEAKVDLNRLPRRRPLP